MRTWMGVLTLAAVITMTSGAHAAGDAANGAKLFKTKLCASCHTLKPEKNMTGPSLAGVFGRQVGTAAKFKFSPDYAKSKAKWDEKTLDAYLTDPKKMFASSRMTVKVPNAKDRADLIAYLKTNPTQ